MHVNKEILEESLEQCNYSDHINSEIGTLNANVTNNSNKYISGHIRQQKRCLWSYSARY